MYSEVDVEIIEDGGSHFEFLASNDRIGQSERHKKRLKDSKRRRHRNANRILSRQSETVGNPRRYRVRSSQHQIMVRGIFTVGRQG